MSELELPPTHPGHMHRYEFAHRFLPMTAFDPRGQALDVWRSDRGNEAVRWLWNRIGEQVAGMEGEVAASSDGLSVEPIDREGLTGALIRMPEPRDINDCHFVAVVETRPATGSPFPWARRPREVRYFTLEFSEPGPRTVLGEWVKTQHRNFGTGPLPEVSAFLDAVAGLLRDENHSVASHSRPSR